jgi:putative sigma-54 modulation protein
MLEVVSDVDEYNVHGGYGGARKNLPQDAQSDKKYQARKQKQIQQYFKQIFRALLKPERLFVFGPGETRKLFVRELRENTKYTGTRVSQAPAEQMPANQIQLKVREHFRINSNSATSKVRQPKKSEDTVDVIHEFVRMKNSEATEKLVGEKLVALRKKYPRIIRAKSFYKKEKDPNARNFICEIELSIPGENLFAQSRESDLTSAVAETFRDLERQLRKRKEKRRAR